MQRRSNVGAGLPAKTSAQQTLMLTDPPLSRASRIVAPPLPQGNAASRSSKVTRRKGGTLSGHDRSNGYVHKPKKHQRKESRRYSCLSQPHQSSTAPTSGQCDSSTIPRSVALLADGWRTPRYSAAPLRMHDRQPHANAELITTRDLEPGRALAPPIVLPARRCVTRCFDPSGFCLYKKTARNTPCSKSSTTSSQGKY